MIDYSNASFSANVANEILSRALEYENSISKISLPDDSPFTMEQVLEAGKEAGLNFKSIETAADAYFDEQVIRRSNLTKTRITEERVLDSEADQLTIWHQILSELSYRMRGKPVIQTYKYKENIWKLTDRTGNDTTVKLHKQGKKVKLMLSQKISYLGPQIESLAAGWFIAVLLGIYLFVFLPTSLSINIALIIGFMAILPLFIRKMMERKRAQKIKEFERLAEHITDQIPRFNVISHKESEGEPDADKDSPPLFSIRKAFTKRDTRF